jgi:hypothetical protein
VRLTDDEAEVIEARSQKGKMMAGKSMHVSFDIGYLERLSDAKLDGVLTRNGKPLSANAIRALLIGWRELGFEIVPLCDHHDERGYCLGHPMVDDNKVMCG